MYFVQLQLLHNINADNAINYLPVYLARCHNLDILMGYLHILVRGKSYECISGNAPSILFDNFFPGILFLRSRKHTVSIAPH
jgi:hypothetical protein